MTIPRTILVAASRWLRLLQLEDLSRARSILHNRSIYTDITPTQYATALEWLGTVSQVDEYLTNIDLYVDDTTRHGAVLEAILARLFEENQPPWLLIANAVVCGADDIPSDMADWLEIFGILDEQGLVILSQYIGRIDLEARRALGEQGEANLVAALEEVWPGSTSHVALYADGLGYDIAFKHGGCVWHFEVKSTRDRYRENVFVSRNEYNVSVRDTNWILVLLKIRQDGHITRLSVVQPGALIDRVPIDKHSNASWESCRFSFADSDISAGLCSALSIPATEARLPIFQIGRNEVPTIR